MGQDVTSVSDFGPATRTGPFGAGVVPTLEPAVLAQHFRFQVETLRGACGNGHARLGGHAEQCLAYGSVNGVPAA